MTGARWQRPRKPRRRSPVPRARQCASRTPKPVRASFRGRSRASTRARRRPAWMKQRLERSGIRSISAVVDVTNYVMLELGQPLHAYDDRLLDGAIVVRFARPGEKLTLLNEQVLDLEPDLLLVADRQAAGPRRASWAASIPASATRRRRCSSRARSGTPPSSRASRAGSDSRAMPATASSAASISAAAGARSSARRS